jgi:hypothetical protein
MALTQEELNKLKTQILLQKSLAKALDMYPRIIRMRADIRAVEVAYAHMMTELLAITAEVLDSSESTEQGL